MHQATSGHIGTGASPARLAVTWLHRIEWDRMVAALIAVALLALAMGLPLWKMTLLAPQYPGGLHMTSYGDRFEGDVREINILNHYIGMKPINADDVIELSLFRPGMIVLIVALLVLALAPLPHWLKVVQSLGIWLLPLGLVLDLQWWLYRYGHSMDPEAPLRVPAFTPQVVGTTKVMNFHNEASFAIGFWLIVAAALVISIGPTLLRGLWELPQRYGPGAWVLIVAAVLVAGGGRAQAAEAPKETLAALIAAAEPGETILVPPGTYHEQVIIDKSVVLRGRKGAVIDGGGLGDVIVVKADNVEISGFTIRNGGRAVSQEPAGVRLLGHHTVLSDNVIEDVHFGVMVQGGGHHEIGFNTIRPDRKLAVEWRGHAISLWNTEHNVIRRNQISHAKDGFYISFSHHNYIHGNHVTKSRFGIHYMYAEDNRFTENVFTGNLSGALVMYSKRLLIKGNEFTNNRGNTAHGLLLKNVDELWAEDNRISGNNAGISLDDTPSSPTGSVIFRRNLIALNQVGLALMTNTAATFTENSIVDNVRQVSGRGGSLIAQAVAIPDHGGEHGGGHGAHQAAPGAAVAGASAKNQWTADGRGNYWSDYAGYDADGDGVGDRPYRPTSAFASLRDRNPGVDLFRYTPAQQAIDAAGRLFPVVRPEVLIEDAAPLTEPPTPLPEAGNSRGLLLLSAGLLLVAAVPIVAGRFPFRRMRTAPMPLRMIR